MTIAELKDIADAELVQDDYTDAELSGAYTSDLLSDVMAHASAGNVLVTMQAHRNTVAVASLVGAPAIVLCNDRPVPDDMLDAAREEKIAIFRTSKNQFEVSGRIWMSFHAQ
jgi:serine kinase of HPr protein (carbohydrate metabolism regulator)